MEKSETIFSITQLSSVFSSLKLKADGKGIDFNIKTLSSFPEKVKTDLVKLEQILVNVIGNAIKFTDQGSIIIQIQYLSGKLSFTVEDSGLGIPKERQDKLFTDFYQAHSDIRQKTTGTGLGLSYARKLAQLLDGDVELVHSSPQLGSVFRIEVSVTALGPSKEVSHESLLAPPLVIKKTHPSFRGSGLRVLLAEDNLDLQELTRLRLEGIGVDVAIAANGQQAVEMITTEKRPFDLVLMDIQMPIMDGYTAVRKLRDLGYTLPIIACSARLMKEERETGLQAGFSEYLEKPIELGKFVELCKTLNALPPKDEENELVREFLADPQFRELLTNMAARLPNYIEILQKKTQEKDYQSLKKVLHDMKGTLVSFGFQDAADVCAKLEKSQSYEANSFEWLFDKLKSINKKFGPDGKIS